MWKEEVSIETKASPDKIWQLWSDVKSWNSWDPDVKHSEIDGNFETGTHGTLEPTSGPKSKFEIISADKSNEFTTRSSLPLAKMDFTHKITKSGDRYTITHGVEISGFTTFIFSRVVGKNIIKGLPKALNNLSEMAEKK